MALLITTEADGSRWVSLDDLEENGVSIADLERWVNSPNSGRFRTNLRDSGICDATATRFAICGALGIDTASVTEITIYINGKDAPKITIEKHFTKAKGEALAKVFQKYVPAGYTE